MIGAKKNNYRTLDLRQLEIEIDCCKDFDYQKKVKIGVAVNNIAAMQQHRHKFKLVKNHNHDVNNLSEQEKNSIIRCIHDMILSNEWELSEDYLTTNQDHSGWTYFEKEHIQFPNNDPWALRLSPRELGKFSYFLSQEKKREQAKLTRKAILPVIMQKYSDVPYGWLIYEVFMPEDIVTNELKYMKEEGLLTISENQKKFDYEQFPMTGGDDINQDHNRLFEQDYEVRLTAKGRNVLEKINFENSNLVFCILKCGKSEPFVSMRNLYKNVIEQDENGNPTGLIAYIQEDENPAQLVINEIYEQIRNCKFVLADITGGSESCIYELGYAHGLGKRFILARNREEFEEMKTFDLNQYSHILWDELDDEHKSKIRKAIADAQRGVENEVLNAE